jgi:hypothetical protein
MTDRGAPARREVGDTSAAAVGEPRVAAKRDPWLRNTASPPSRALARFASPNPGPDLHRFLVNS